MNFFHCCFFQTMEDQIYVDIAKAASIYRGLRSYERLVQMVDHSREYFMLQYMNNGDLNTYL